MIESLEFAIAGSGILIPDQSREDLRKMLSDKRTPIWIEQFVDRDFAARGVRFTPYSFDEGSVASAVYAKGPY